LGFLTRNETIFEQQNRGQNVVIKGKNVVVRWLFEEERGKESE
jgi:hypothetical protein